LADSSKSPTKRPKREVNKVVLGTTLAVPIIGVILIIVSLLAPSTLPDRDILLVVSGVMLGFGGLAIEEYFVLSVERAKHGTLVGKADGDGYAAEELAAIGRAEAERKQKLEEESKEHERQEKLARAYHEELITKIYEPWCQKGIEDRGSLAGYPPTQNQPKNPGYVWIPIGFELESNSEPGAHPELPMIRDALAHLDDETSKARKRVWDGMIDYNDSVKALIRWPSYIANVIDQECGLREATGINQPPQESKCDMSVLIECFDRHFYRSENATIGPPLKGVGSSLGLTLLPVHYAGHDQTLASSSDDSELTKLMKRIGPWGKHYADARRGLDSKRESLSTDLKTFQSGTAQLIQTLRFRPRLVKGKCSIEESFAEPRGRAEMTAN
jgi:hypothetical protein